MFENRAPSNHFSIHSQIRNLQLEQLILFEMGTYHDQFRRSYTSDSVTMDNFRIIQDRVNAVNYNNGGRIDATVLGGVGLSFIKPNPAPDSPHSIAIPNGWNARRFRFMMRVSYERAQGQKYIEVLTGYTDDIGISSSLAINPMMVFHINSVIHLRESEYNTPYGMQKLVTVAENSHLLGKTTYTGLAYNSEVRMRPQEVFIEMGSLHLDRSGGFRDTRTMHDDRPAKSSRQNASPNAYMGRILENYFNGARVADMEEQGSNGNGGPPGTPYDKARFFANDKAVSSDAVLAQLGQISGTDGPSTTFRFQDLLAIDNTIAQRLIMRIAGTATPSGPALQNLHDHRMTHNWSGSDYDDYVATVISQTVASMMSDLALTRVVFKVTNHTIGAFPHWEVIDAAGFAQAYVQEAFGKFQTMFIHQLMNELSYHGEVSYRIEVNADLLGETAMKISFGNNPLVDYVAPTFADALTVPVLSVDPNAAHNIAVNVDNLVKMLSENTALGNKPQPTHFNRI